MEIEAFKLFEALNSSWIKKREVYKNKILNKFILCLHVAVSTAITHNPKILVVLNGKGLFLTQRLGSAGGLCSTPPRLEKPRLLEAPLLAAARADVAGKGTQRVTPCL